MEILIYDKSFMLTIVSVLIGVLIIAYWHFVRYDEDAIQYEVPLPEQCSPSWEGQILDIPSIKTSGLTSIQCYCPCDGKLLATINPVTATGIDRSISNAEKAQVQWAKTTYSQRKLLLRTIQRFIIDNQKSIAKVACLDSGKTLVDAFLGEILVTAEKLKWTIDHGEKSLQPESRPTNLLMLYKSNKVTWEPLGVVAACVSWNYPFHNLIGPVIAAVFAGNAIIVKVSENTAWSSIYFSNIIKGALTACGHSPNLVQVVCCWPSVAEHLTSHPKISHITFIGSRPVAHAVCSSAAKALTPVCVELGGKDPAIVLDDAEPDLPRITKILMRGVFQAAGQNCIGIERIIALPNIYEKVIHILTPLIKALRVGNDLASQSEEDATIERVDVGACISAANFTFLENLIAEAVTEGATLVTGGTRLQHPHYPKGHYFKPTLITGVTPAMRIAQVELFAPVCVLMRADSIDSAIAIANGTSYGLGASVFGRDTSDLNRLVREVRAGMVAVNDFAAYYAVQLPFGGGVKGSGYGRFAGQEGLRALCNTKAVCRDRWPRWVKTSIPPELTYPIGNATRAGEFCRGVVLMGYGLGWRDELRGLFGIFGL